MSVNSAEKRLLLQTIKIEFHEFTKPGIEFDDITLCAKIADLFASQYDFRNSLACLELNPSYLFVFLDDLDEETINGFETIQDIIDWIMNKESKQDTKPL